MKTIRLPLLPLAVCSLLLFFAGHAEAQINLKGRVFHSSNIITKELVDRAQNLEKETSKARAEAYAKAEKEKGRALTADEKADLDAQLDESVKLMQAMVRGMKASMTVEFISEKALKMKTDMTIDDDVLKEFGLGWAKRKVVKAVCAAANKSNKCAYTIQGDRVIVDDGESPDTLHLSSDGRQLTGHFDADIPFTLTRKE